MTTWPEMQLPPINLYNAPARGKDAIVSDRDEFEAWINVSRYAMAATSFEEAMFCTWQAARSEAFVLRKQAEAIVKAAEANGLAGGRSDYALCSDLICDAKEMFEQADELEKAGGGA